MANSDLSLPAETLILLDKRHYLTILTVMEAHSHVILVMHNKVKETLRATIQLLGDTRETVCSYNYLVLCGLS